MKTASISIPAWGDHAMALEASEEACFPCPWCEVWRIQSDFCNLHLSCRIFSSLVMIIFFVGFPGDILQCALSFLWEQVLEKCRARKDPAQGNWACAWWNKIWQLDSTTPLPANARMTLPSGISTEKIHCLLVKKNYSNSHISFLRFLWTFGWAWQWTRWSATWIFIRVSLPLWNAQVKFHEIEMKDLASDFVQKLMIEYDLYLPHISSEYPIHFDQRSEAALLQRMCQARCWAQKKPDIKHEVVGCNRKVGFYTFAPLHLWMDFWLVIFCTRWIPSSRWGPMLSFGWCFRSGGSASSPKPEPTFGCSDSTFWHQIGEPKASRTGLKVFLATHLKNILMQYHNIAASYTSQSHEHFSCDISKPKCKQNHSPKTTQLLTFQICQREIFSGSPGARWQRECWGGKRMGILEGLGWESISVRQIWRGNALDKPLN